jgi:hypothetical protein
MDRTRHHILFARDKDVSTTAPTAYALQGVVSAAMQTLEMLRTEHGQVIDTDDELLAALADEQVNIPRVLTLLFRGAAEAASLAEAAKSRIADQRQRMERFARDQQSKRDLAQQVMEAVGLKSFKCAEASVSLGVGPTRVIVTDEDALTDDFVIVVTTRTPNKVAIAAALKDGREVDGAMLSNGTTVLRILSR